MAISPAERMREHRRKNPLSNRQAVSKTQAKKRSYLWQYKASQGCRICGETDPIVLEIDHLDPSMKTRNGCSYPRSTDWSRMSWKAIAKELAGCQVLCANCHRRKTYEEHRPRSFDAFDDLRGRWSRQAR